MTITIKPVKNYQGCYHFQEVVRQTWESEPIDNVAVHVLMTVIKNGGMVLGAYHEDGPSETGGMVGTAFWWLGTGIDPALGPNSPSRLKACSHMVGVLPGWQGQHIGLRLKLAQRQEILNQGLTDWVTWTYDPLFRANGVFNIHRLGATCSTYARNVYGELRDGLNAGVPSDRCQVDWRLNSPHVFHDLEPSRKHQEWDLEGLEILPIEIDSRGFVSPLDAEPRLDGRPLAVPIPADITAIRQVDGALSMTWRHYMRAMLEASFAAGYSMVDCVHLTEPGETDHRWCYILVREYI